MPIHLPVSSFPDVVPHDRRAITPDIDIRIVLTPPPSSKCRARLPRGFGKSSSRPATPTMPDSDTECPNSVVEVSRIGIYPGVCESSPMMYQRSHPPRLEPYHHAHHRSTSSRPSRHRLSWSSALSEHRAPRSTKESIANLGLSRRTPSPDSSTSSDTDSMIACCFSSGWIEPQALPPLPPVPPTSPSPCSDPPSRSTSSMGHDVKESFEIIPDSHDDGANDLDVKDCCSEQSSAPPSPITFSHRNSAFIAVESSQGLDCANETILTTISLDADPSLPWLPSSRSPTPNSRKCHDALTLSPVSEAAVAARPWVNVSHVPTAVLFAPPPKLLSGETSTAPSSPLSSKLSAKLHSWKFFRRRHSVSADDDEPSKERQSNDTAVEPTKRPETRCAWTRRRHRNSVHVMSISSMPGELSSPRCSSVGSDQTLSNRPELEVPHRLSAQRSMGTLRSVTTHRVAGDRWREEDIETVIDTLRTMKVGKLR